MGILQNLHTKLFRKELPNHGYRMGPLGRIAWFSVGTFTISPVSYVSWGLLIILLLALAFIVGR